SVSHTHSHASWWIGVIHGLAGGTHVLGVLPTLAMPSRTAAAAYLISFSAGTMIAMAVFSAGIGWISVKLIHRSVPLHSLLMGSGVVCIGLGFYWLWS
ncbi:High-affinity nickel transporter, partial [bacterium]|nr:High-affinity nickel transporter [bacterium]